MNEIIPISIWSGGMINCFLIKGTQKHVLVDTGLPGSENTILSQLKNHQIKPEQIGLIIVTHCHIDHFGSAGNLQKILNVPILSHKLDEAYFIKGTANLDTMKPNKLQWGLFKQLVKNQKAVPFKPDILLEGNIDFDLKYLGISGKVTHTPGHTPGSLSVILKGGEAIIMDMMSSGILLGGIIFRSRIKHPPFHDDFGQLKNSFEKVLTEKTETFYLGHGGPVKRKQVIFYYEKYLKHVKI